MESQWTNKYAIMRDLSVAQGRKVHSRIVGSIGCTEKPPALNLKEETEEEFFEDCTGELHDKPDFEMIKYMLDMVREIEISSDLDDGDTQKTVEISKLNPCSNEFVPAENGGGDHSKAKLDQCCNVENAFLKTTTPKKHRRHANVALTSILESLENKFLDDGIRKEKDDSWNSEASLKETYENGACANVTRKEPIILLKPNDFISHANLTEIGWMECPQTLKKGPISVLPTGMFTKKSKSVPNNGITFNCKDANASRMEADLFKQQDNLYVPSTLADEYYQKYVERSKVQEQTKRDIWERAERQMKEIDAKRMQEKESAISPASSLNESSSSSEKEGMESVRLSHHRHELAEECVVCRVLGSPGGDGGRGSARNVPSPPTDTCADKLDMNGTE